MQNAYRVSQFPETCMRNNEYLYLDDLIVKAYMQDDQVYQI